jgi:hypothetical protein
MLKFLQTLRFVAFPISINESSMEKFYNVLQILYFARTQGSPPSSSHTMHATNKYNFNSISNGPKNDAMKHQQRKVTSSNMLFAQN